MIIHTHLQPEIIFATVGQLEWFPLVHAISVVANVECIKKLVKVCSEFHSLLYVRSTCKLKCLRD